MLLKQKKLEDFNISYWEMVLEELFLFSREKTKELLLRNDFFTMELKEFAKIAKLSTPEVEKILTYAESQSLEDSEITNLDYLLNMEGSDSVKPTIFDLSINKTVNRFIKIETKELSQMDPKELRELILDFNREKVFICENGKRSLSAAMFFKGRGGKNLKWVADGWATKLVTDLDLA